jgi:hypothetical protein
MSETSQHIKDLVTTPLTDDERQRVQKDLHFIDLATQIGKDLGYRVFIHGGYAVDGNLGQVTRPHKDLDIQIYGQDADANKAASSLLSAIKNKDAEFEIESTEDKGRQDYYHNLLIRQSNAAGIDLYYIQVTTDPFGEEKVIVKKDGSLSDTQSFGEPNMVTLEGVTFEAASPTEELVDKLYKREHRGDTKEPKHDQDIRNLRLITDTAEVEQKLAERVNRK